MIVVDVYDPNNNPLDARVYIENKHNVLINERCIEGRVSLPEIPEDINGGSHLIRVRYYTLHGGYRPIEFNLGRKHDENLLFCVRMEFD